MPRSTSAERLPQLLGVERVKSAPARAASAVTGCLSGGTGSKAQRNSPVRTSKARTTPGGASTRCPSITKEPVMTRSSKTRGAEET